MYIKQVIAVRTDLNMPVGKVAAQVAHASMAVILNRMVVEGDNRLLPLDPAVPHNESISSWIDGAFTKIVVGVDSEEKLLALFDKATQLGIPCSKIVDNGLTVFNGVPTLTCCGFGPADSDTIDSITKRLRLLK